jgi:flagellar hook-associated protein 2
MTSIQSTNIGLQTPTITDSNLVGNLNTQAIIQAELQQYELPITDLQDQQSTLNSDVSDYQQINTDLATLQTDAAALTTPSDWQQMQATSSNSTVATATAAQGTPAGSIEFTVQQLAAAETMVSSGTVSSTADVVTSAPDFLLSQASGIGFSALASNGLTLGTHTIAVTQASQAAETTGSTSFSSSSAVTVTSGSNDTIDLTVNGTAYTATLAAGTYDGAQLAAAVNTALTTATDTATGATVDLSSVVQAGLNGAGGTSGSLVLATTAQGSSQSLQVTGGDALSTLGLTAMASASTGVDALVSVDGGAAQDVGTISAGSTLSLTAPTGSVSATVGQAGGIGASLLTVGSTTATDVSTGNGSLADVVANINASGTDITASAVQTGTDSYVLQLASSQTGASNDLTIDPSAFSSSSLGTLQVASAGTDAQIQVGGAGGYTLTSATDTFSGLLPGLTVTANQVSATPVTVTVATDASALAGKVQTMVTDANTVLADVQKYAGYNEATKQGGPLMGSAVLQNLTNQVESIIASVTGTSTLGNAENIGITLGANGTLSFDKTTFENAVAANPTQVADMFTQGGTFTPSSSTYAGQVSVSAAQNTTQSGAYDVTITQSAQQAVSDGAVLSSGSVSAAETLTMAMGGTSVSYTTTAGQSLSSIAAGINAALAHAGLALSASVVDNGQQLELASSAYGSGASFSVTTTNTASGTTGLAGPSAVAGTPTTFTGTDVAGTIDGQAATGNGQFLTVPDGASSPAAGLSLLVTASGITSPTTLGTLTYSPGIAQSLASLANALSSPTSGSITTTIKNLQNQSQGLTSQIAFYQNIAAEEQKLLTEQYSQLETTLGTLQNQGNSLSSALSSMTTL